ncbi:MAG: hypothetical protein PF693_16680 [Spirochaetia bacterium]|jgi:putative ABC transport system permease protein|nr:hypothetical protein [Spirochaetia bacterium]
MNLINISLYSLKRQKEIADEFDEFGANIVITPKTDSLSLSYGGINLSGIVTSMEEINLIDVEKIRSIENSANISAVSPKLIGVGQVKSGDFESEVLLVGVISEEERKLKTWWDIEGEFPIGNDEILAGREVADKLNLDIGSCRKPD